MGLVEDGHLPWLDHPSRMGSEVGGFLPDSPVRSDAGAIPPPPSSMAPLAALPYPGAMTAGREFEVVLEAADEGGFVVSVPDLAGCWTQGETRDEALANVKEAIGTYLEALEELGRPLPKPRREHVTITA